MHILRTNIQGNTNVGLYGFCTDKICLVGKEVPDKIAEEIEKVLRVPVHKITIAGTSLVGVFVAGNNNHIIVPGITFSEEIKILEKLGLNISVIDTKLTALGNNIVVNDTGCMVNKDFEKSTLKQIEQGLLLSPKKGLIAESEVVGSCAVITNEFGYIHNEIKDFEKEFIESNFKIKVKEGTVNMGNPYVGSGLLVNKNGFIIGGLSTGIETSLVDESFGFLPGVQYGN